MTPKEAEKKYGKRLWNKIKRSKWMDGITVSLNENGETDIPECDIERAYRDVTNQKTYSLDWD